MGLTGRTGGPESSAPPAAARVSTARGGRPAAAEAATRVEEEEESWSIVVEVCSKSFFCSRGVEQSQLTSVTFFPLQQRRRERPPCAFPFSRCSLFFFRELAHIDTAALVVVRQGIKTDKNNNKNETGKSPLLCVAVNSPFESRSPSLF